MNRSSADAAGSGRPRLTLVIGAGIAFGVAGFFAGRLSVQLAASHLAAAMAGQHGLANGRGAAGPGPASAPGAATTHPASSAGANWDQPKWHALMSQPGSMARNTALEKMLEQLAATDPQRAMALAQAEGNLKLRGDLVQAVLAGWATTAPADAAKWALDLANPSDRSNAMKTVLGSAADTDPAGAVQVTKLIMQLDPGDGVNFGQSLIDALCTAGDFETAAKFSVDGTDQQRSFWMAESYSKWAEFQPEEAALAAIGLSDPALRIQALQGVVGGWGQADPAALTQVLSKLPSGSDRSSMLGQAMEQWVRLDPTAAAAWVNNNSDLGADLDQSKKTLANMDLFSSNVQPEASAGLAESIVDPAVRSEALANLLRDWALKDKSAARHYLDATTNLLPADREQIESVFADLSRNDPK